MVFIFNLQLKDDIFHQIFQNLIVFLDLLNLFLLLIHIIQFIQSFDTKSKQFYTYFINTLIIIIVSKYGETVMLKDLLNLIFGVKNDHQTIIQLIQINIIEQTICHYHQIIDLANHLCHETGFIESILLVYLVLVFIISNNKYNVYRVYLE